MKVSILHISDLHRAQHELIQNDSLLSSLEKDCLRYSTEEKTRIRPPDIIVVSGDVIQGISANNHEPEESLIKQYDEATSFLAQLAERFVNNQRNRVVIVPGNHDMSSYHLVKSLKLVDNLSDRKKEYINELFKPESMLRWSWSELKLYMITDHDLYHQRMAAFSRFYTDFYHNQRTYALDPAKQVDIFNYPQFDLRIVGFSSCFNNDLYNRQGSIHPKCIAEAESRLQNSLLSSRLRIAVWHHNIEGPPIQCDYMDSETIQYLIDQGYSLGLHGHQHRPQYLDTKFQYGGKRTMKVISAGTLCGSPNLRYGCAYNIIELDTEEKTGRLHVREMQTDNYKFPIWGCSVLSPNTSTYIDFDYDLPPILSSKTERNTSELVKALDFYNEGKYQKATDILIKIVNQDNLARQPLLDCLVKLNDIKTILEIFDPPVNEAEAIHVMDALWDMKSKERLVQMLDEPIINNSIDPSLIEIRKKYRAKLK